MHLRLQVLLLNMIKRLQKIKWKQYWIYRKKIYLTDHQIILIVLWNATFAIGKHWKKIGLVVLTNDVKNTYKRYLKTSWKSLFNNVYWCFQDWWYVRKHLTEESGWVPAQYLKDEQTYTMYVQKKLVEKIEKLPVFDSKFFISFNLFYNNNNNNYFTITIYNFKTNK